MPSYRPGFVALSPMMNLCDRKSNRRISPHQHGQQRVPSQKLEEGAAQPEQRDF
ncbi:hypothetical protein PGN35_002210 [Nodosilinea sp. PGN35]|uniref:hypothetical protein n=1 Tax=Nodosilinea sp. PGN35 TaxID=3020489 RepID=UPI0023B298D3|nr:hypothetical protein [Nodosilinea sp. TSF1-S3]MDF0368779.1 hypothetical protein [Nodosilinea sp. TSF1-S3]